MNPRGLLPMRQPDDPGVDHDNEFSPVVFRPSMSGRETAWLGSVMVGEIMQAGWGRLRRAQARIHLPVTRNLIGADNVFAAKRAMADEVREWIKAAGLRR
jgi:hypothetical protein